MAPPERLFYKTKSDCRFGEKCSFAHRQVEEQPSKRSQKNGDKSAVAMLKKHDLHDRTEQPVVNRDTSHESKSRTCWVQIIEYTAIGLRLSGHGAAEVVANVTEELRHAETNPACEIHESYCASHWNSRPKFFARIYLPR